MNPTNVASSAVEQGSSEPGLQESRNSESRNSESRNSESTNEESKSELWVILIGLALLYAIAIWVGMRRFVWFDEIFTLDIARASSLSQLWHLSLKFDSNPTPVYLLSRLSMAIFGVNPLGLRLPSILEFFAGSLAMFFYMRRKVGTRYAAVAVLTLWGSGTFFYAIEARPYALIFMCLSFLLLSWDSAITDRTRTASLWGVGISNFGLLSAHVFAPLSLFPFLVAECVRFHRRRKPDYPLWAALLLPTVVMVTYLPLIRNYQKTLIYPHEMQGSFQKAGAFYYYAIDTVVHHSFWIVCAAAAAVFLSRNMRTKLFSSQGLAEKTMFTLLILNPLFLNLILMWRHGSFFDRYCISSEAAIYMAAIFLLDSRWKRGRWTALLASVAMVAVMVHHDVWQVLRRPHPSNVASLANIRPDLLLVDGSGATFLEMNHHESADFLKRVYYLKDREAALLYGHTTYFEDYEAMDEMKPFFHISSAVDSYSSFVREHHEFLLFGSGWIVPELRADGASLTEITPAGLQSPYLGSEVLYIVKMPPNR
jgi:hypothetical protein